MGAQQRILEATLSDAGWRLAPVPRPSGRALAEAGLDVEIARTFRQLGGRGTQPRIAPGGWDIAAEPCIVELDEQRHFNRYRSVSLDSPVYTASRLFDLEDYRRFCGLHEDDCLRSARHGGYWATPVSDREFGPSGPLGVLEGAGPSRWKQRAFYDFVKDAWALTTDLPLIRLAVWELVDESGSSLSLGGVLTRLAKNPDAHLSALVLTHVERRLSAARSS